MEERRNRVKLYKEMARNDYYHGENIAERLEDTDKVLKKSKKAYSLARVKELVIESLVPFILMFAGVAGASKDVTSLAFAGGLLLLDIIALRNAVRKTEEKKNTVEFVEDFMKGYKEGCEELCQENA